MTSPRLRDVAWSGPSIERIADLVAERAGLVFSHVRRKTVETAIRRQAARSGVSDVGRYADALAVDQQALESLAAELTVGETYFFRDPPQIDLLASEIIPALAVEVQGRHIHAWSAGCASGEEAYSLAILFHRQGLAARTRILGTDLSRERIAQAREARYGRWSLRGVPDRTITEYFTRQDTRFDLVRAIRDMVGFRYMNLAEAGESMPAAIDLILCRNVLIYFDAPTVARVARQLMGALSPSGWLLLGASDPPISDHVECDVMVTPAGLVYRPPGVVHPRRRVMYSSGAHERLREPVPEAHRESHREWAPAADAAADAPVPALIAVEGPNAAPAEEWSSRVRAMADAGALEDAGKLCAAALELHPLSAELTYLQALLLLTAGHVAEAAGTARRAIYLDHRLAVAHVLLGDALLRLKQRDDADRAWRAALRLLAAGVPDDVVPASGGESTARFTAAVGARLSLTREPA